MPELRRDITSARWIVSGGQTADEFLKTRDVLNRPSQCLFCPGHESAMGAEIYRFPPPPPLGETPPPWSVRVVPSPIGKLKFEGTLGRRGDGIYDAMNTFGAHEIIVETPDHVKNLSALPESQIVQALQVYQARIRELEHDERFRYTIIFRNQRPALPERFGHSHSQVAGLPVIPKVVKEELGAAEYHFKIKERCIYCDIARQEQDQKERVIESKDGYLTFVPYSARFPFETMILPLRHRHDFMDVPPDELAALAGPLKRALYRVETLLDDPALVVCLHTSPYLRPREGYWLSIRDDYHWHIEILPMVTEVFGFEWSTGFHMQPVLSEELAARLRDLPAETPSK